MSDSDRIGIFSLQGFVLLPRAQEGDALKKPHKAAFVYIAVTEADCQLLLLPSLLRCLGAYFLDDLFQLARGFADQTYHFGIAGI